jgi:hypothetical protein
MSDDSDDDVNPTVISCRDARNAYEWKFAGIFGVGSCISTNNRWAFVQLGLCCKWAAWILARGLLINRRGCCTTYN